MSEFSEAPQSSQAELLLQKPDVQEGLKKVFDGFDASTAKLKEGGATINHSILPGITDDGTYVEVISVLNAADIPGANPNIFETPKNPPSDLRDEQLLVYAFNLGDVRNPEFVPQPLKADEWMGWRRGDHQTIDLAGPEGDSGENDEIKMTTLHGEKGKIDTYRGKKCTPFVDVRKKLGVEL